MSRTYRDRPRRLVKEDARRAGFVTHLRPYGQLPYDRVKAALARACRDWDDWRVYQRHRRWFG